MVWMLLPQVDITHEIGAHNHLIVVHLLRILIRNDIRK